MRVESEAVVLPHKGPNGRPLAVPGLAWVRRGLRLTRWISPAAAAAMADGLFFHPVTAKLRDDERAILAKGRELRIDVDGAQVVGWTWGAGPAVLLVHGWAGHAGQMTALVSAVVEAGFRAIALDMPAHGRSDGRTSSVIHFANAIAAAHETFGPLHAVIAHSLGAGAATYAIARGLPVDRAVFFAPPGDFEQFWSRFRQGLGITPDVWSRMQARAEARLGVRFEDILPLRHAPHLSTRLRVFHDEHDREIPLASGESLVAAWPGAELVKTRGLGHMRILKDPALAAQAAAFLKDAQLPAAAGAAS